MSRTKAQHYNEVLLPQIMKSERSKMTFFRFICGGHGEIPGLSSQRRQQFLETAAKKEKYEIGTVLLVFGVTAMGMIWRKPCCKVVQQRSINRLLNAFTTLAITVLLSPPLVNVLTADMQTNLRGIISEVNFTDPDLLPEEDYHKYKDYTIDDLALVNLLYRS